MARKIKTVDVYEDNIPSEITVCGKVFEIEIVNSFPDDEQHNKDYGECCGPEYKIKISRANGTSHFKRTLLHESIHALFYVTGLGELFDQKMEEAVVVALENNLPDLAEVFIDMAAEEVGD